VMMPSLAPHKVTDVMACRRGDTLRLDVIG
jgi:hypothetical protein